MVQVSGQGVSPGPVFGLCSRPCLGEHENGDRGAVFRRDGVLLAIVADGLGHGPKAARAAGLAVDLVEATHERDPRVIMGLVNEALKGSVGAAASIVVVDCRTGTISHCGVGNVATRLTGVGIVENRLIGIGGVLGSLRRVPRLEQACLLPGGMLVMTTDGVSLAFEAATISGIAPADAARLLVERHGRPHDDATALVMRIAP